MKDIEFYLVGTISASLSFIQDLIPVVQLTLLIISLVCTLIGIVKQIKKKLAKGEDISEDVIKASEEIKNTIEKIKEGSEDGKGSRKE